MNEPVIGRLVTGILEDHSKPLPEGGFFELNITISLRTLKHEPNPRGYVMKTISNHLSVAVIDTGVPPEKWRVELTEAASNQFNIPRNLRLG